jgi:hypothetical protein
LPTAASDVPNEQKIGIDSIPTTKDTHIMTATEPVSEIWIDTNHLIGLKAHDFNKFSPIESSNTYVSTGTSLTKYARRY